jgi:predicted lipase
VSEIKKLPEGGICSHKYRDRNKRVDILKSETIKRQKLIDDSAPLTDVTGYVATDTTNNLTIISFQGTESAKQAIADLNLSLMNISDVCSGCTVHTGFWQSWNESRLLVTQALQDLRKKYPDNKVITTGHSLGGAIATLAAAELRSSGILVDLVS